MHVKDPPVEYLQFECVLPSGEYGGRDVIVWDTGTWEPRAHH
jgi:bifunctional non-homologous end joining protein LigD